MSKISSTFAAVIRADAIAVPAQAEVTADLSPEGRSVLYSLAKKEDAPMITKKLIVLIGLMSATPLSLWIGWGLYTINTTERPAYEIVRRLEPPVEIREYGAQSWITTDYAGDASSFRVLASYIFGGNEQGQKVAMTAPVISDDRMAFILPGGVTPENAPTPEGQPIDFIEVPPRKLATFTFSWTTPDDRVERKTGELLAVLDSHGVRTKGQPFLMRYNDPWTPPFMRRNEIAVEVQ